MEDKDKEIILKFDSMELNGNISAGDMLAMFSAALQQVCDMLKEEFGSNDEDVDYCLGMLIHAIIAGKTDKEIAKILTQTELIRREYKKFMENKGN